MQLEAQLHTSGTRVAVIGQVGERRDRMVVTCRRFAIRRSCSGLSCRAVEVIDRLFPKLAVQGMVCEPFDVLGRPPGVEPFDCLDDRGVQRSAAIVKHAPVGGLVGQRVFEGVLEIGEMARLVEELRGLEVCQARA
jgi:hypothetical protein